MKNKSSGIIVVLFVRKVFLNFLFIKLLMLCSVLALFSSNASAENDEQFWIKTTTSSLIIDWNVKSAVEDPVIRLDLSSFASGILFWDGVLTGSRTGDVVRFELNGLEPDIWSPAMPNLYHLSFVLSAGGEEINKFEYRVGFRSFDTQGGRLYLNDYPIFLRGIAINPPGRGIPEEVETSRDFAREYVRFMKSLHVNIIRIPDNSTWYEVCDEEGMMVFGGNYSVAIAGARIPAVYDDGVTWYKEQKFAPFVHHPSLVIWALTNEVPYQGEIARQWVDFLTYAYGELKQWDPTRLYICNAGYGYGESGDINDLHRYWGWYYASPYTYLHIRDYDSIVFPDKVQPLTFTECVGNYTGPDGRYNLTPNHKNPVSQKKWTGHAPTNQQQLLADEHQAWVFKEATELMRRLRRINPESSGVFPFTIMFRNWHTVRTFTDMDTKPVNWQARTSYQPVLLSWENWMPHAYAGNSFQAVAHIVNDDDHFADLKNNSLVVHVLDKALAKVYTDTFDIQDIPYYDIYSHPVKIELPGTLFTGRYYLEGIVYSDNREVSRNKEPLFIASRSFAGIPPEGSIALYDPKNDTREALKSLGIGSSDFIPGRMPELSDLIVIGENAADQILETAIHSLRQFVRNGGRVLVLKQDALHQQHLSGLFPVSLTFPTMDIDNPAYPPPVRPSANSFNINTERPFHPVFYGITRSLLRMWSDYTSWDETQKGLPHIYPVSHGFMLDNKEDISHTAVLANYSVGLEGIATAEFFEGKGSILLTGFDMVSRVGMDPAADRLLMNKVTYMGGQEQHVNHPLVDNTVSWGEYETEFGLLTGIYSGFMLNSRPALFGSYEHLPILLLKDGHMYGERGGGWNNRAGLQYMPYGRRMFGPYYHRGFAGTPTILDPETDTGHAFFWCRVPEQTKTMLNLVWNPADEELEFVVNVNHGPDIVYVIRAGEYKMATVPITYSSDSFRFDFYGDRRLVVLETTFTK